ncbi:teichuronic acid biosynthesis protein TuaB [Bacillus sp. KH172YL63]|uniref:teichuronic acid biosynthesis protein TuaB n=1 Tax=Bacillus sp. KH172YL63 TaxID=2709784 RepID=UPI001564A3EC|nr:MOP flippase family protein [Bacillus sp. KH172YL63]
MSSLMKQLIGGMKWTGSATIINTGMQLLQYVILGRLLAKSDFGLMGMVTVIIAFAQVFTDMGVGNAIVHRQNATHKQLSTLYWLNVFTGIGVAIIVFLSAPLVAHFYSEPRLVELIHLIALIFCIIPFGQQFQYLMQKNLEFDRIAKTEITSVVLGVCLAIILAFAGVGVYSLVIGQIAFHATKSILYGLQGWSSFRPSFYFKLGEVKGFLSFGVYQMGSRSVSYFSSNIDYILIGRFLGAEALGIYTIAYQLVVVPVTKINPLITRVAFPLFAKVQNSNDSLSKGFTDMSKMLAVITFPILFGLMCTADLLVPVMFGEKWTASIPLVQILSALGLLRVLMNPNGSILLAKGRADIGFKWDLGVASIHAIAFYLVVNMGIEAVAITYVLLALLNFLLGRILLHHVIGLDGREYFRGLSKPAFFSVSMAVIVYAGYLLLSFIHFPTLIIPLSILILLGVIIYGALVFTFDKAYLVELKGSLKKKKV